MGGGGQVGPDVQPNARLPKVIQRVQARTLAVCGPHLDLPVAVPRGHVGPVLHQVLQQLASRGRPQYRGVPLLLKHTRLVANGDPVAGGISGREYTVNEKKSI